MQMNYAWEQSKHYKQCKSSRNKIHQDRKIYSSLKFTFMPQKYPPARQKAYFIKFHGDPSKHCEDISLL